MDVTEETIVATRKRKCGLDEGHCKSDKDCKEGLKCGSGNCYNWYSKLWWKGHDCCFKPGINRIVIVTS